MLTDPRPLLLAVDDDPGRYDYLRVVLGDRVRLVVATCRACVEEHLPGAAAVLLDFDLDGAEECAGCAGWIDVANSTAYLDAVIARRVPVIVSSCSSHANRAHLARVLGAAGIEHAAIPADHLGVELEWVGRLWVWGVLA